MGFHLAFFLLLASLLVTPSQEVTHALILVDGTQLAAETDDNFICATIDWWPHDKCDYNHCPWGYSSAVNLDLSHPLLAKAIQGSDKHLEKKIPDPRYLDKVASTFGNLSETIKKHGPWSSAWVGENSFIYHLKRTFSWIGTKGSDISFREEYHLTPGGENLRSQTMLLNGIRLELTDEGEIPSLDPVRDHVYSPIYLSALSIAYIVYPNFDAPTCVRRSD